MFGRGQNKAAPGGSQSNWTDGVDTHLVTSQRADSELYVLAQSFRKVERV